MLAISFKGYNSIVDEGNKKWIKIYDTSNLLNMINGMNYLRTKVNHSRKKLFLKD